MYLEGGEKWKDMLSQCFSSLCSVAFVCSLLSHYSLSSFSTFSFVTHSCIFFSRDLFQSTLHLSRKFCSLPFHAPNLSLCSFVHPTYISVLDGFLVLLVLVLFCCCCLGLLGFFLFSFILWALGFYFFTASLWCLSLLLFSQNFCWFICRIRQCLLFNPGFVVRRFWYDWVGTG